MKDHDSFMYVYVVVKTLNLVISSCCFDEYGREVYKKCLPLVKHDHFPLLTNNIIAFWCCRSRSPHRSFNCLEFGFAAPK